MPRPRCRRRITFRPTATLFKPQGIPARDLKTVILSHEEAEALRLKDLEGFDQTACAERMDISQSTFQRTLAVARRKTSEAIISGKALLIEDT
jgi:predicted DNA-binding protein (UPF0251 family)